MSGIFTLTKGYVLSGFGFGLGFYRPLLQPKGRSDPGDTFWLRVPGTISTKTASNLVREPKGVRCPRPKKLDAFAPHNTKTATIDKTVAAAASVLCVSLVCGAPPPLPPPGAANTATCAFPVAATPRPPSPSPPSLQQIWPRIRFSLMQTT